MMKKLLLLSFVFVTITLSAQILTDGLISHYPLDGTADDLTANNNHGILVDGVMPTEDRFGTSDGALEFNGQDGYVNVPNHSSLNFTNEMSISVWIKVANLSNLNFMALVNKWEDNVGGYYLGINNNAFELRWNTGTTFSDGSPIVENEWTHLVVPYSASAMVIYRNGMEDNSVAGGGPLSANDVDLRFGQQSQIFGNSLFYSGDMDEILIYDRALTSDEVAQIYDNAPSSITSAWADSDIEIYPNPFQDFFQIKSNGFSNGNLKGEVLDPKGRLTQQFPVNSYNQSVSTSNIEKGFYILIIRDDKGTVKREKLLKI